MGGRSYGAIEKADSFVFVISPDGIISPVSQQELLHALEHHKKIIPVVRREVDTKTVPESLAKLNWLFFREHDSFDASLQALIQAINTDLDYVRAHTRLLLKALEWEGRGRDKSLFLRGGELKRAEEWLTEIGDKEPRPTPLMLQFLGASRQGATVRQRLTLGAVSLALVVAVSLALVAFFQYREAKSQKESALARGLAAQSELLRSQQPHLLERSVLLAVESLRRRATLEGSLALQRGLSLLGRRSAILANSQGLRSGDMVLSPDGKWLAWVEAWIANKPGRIHLWNAATGEVLSSLTVEDSPFVAVAFSPDGLRLGTLTDNGTLRVTEVATGGELQKTFLKSKGLRKEGDAIISPDDKFVAARVHGRVKIWEINTGRELASPNGLVDPEAVKPYAFTRDKPNLIIGYQDGTIEVLEISSGSSLARFKAPHSIDTLTVSPDGKFLAAMIHEKEVRIWHLDTKKLTGTIPRKGLPLLFFSQNGRLLISDRYDGVGIYRAENGGEVLRIKPFDTRHATLSPNGRWLALVEHEHVVTVYDLTNGQAAKRLPSLGVSEVVFSPDSKGLFTGGHEGVIKWQFTGLGEAVDVTAEEMVFSPDGKLLVTNGLIYFPAVWDTTMGQRLCSLEDVAFNMHFNPNGKWLAAVLNHKVSDKVIPTGVYDSHTGKLASRITTPAGSLFAGFRADSGTLLTVSGDNHRKYWDPATGKLLDSITGPALPAHLKEGGSVLSPQGKWYLGVGEDQNLKIWEVASGREVFQLGPAWEKPPPDKVLMEERLREYVEMALKGTSKISNYSQVLFSHDDQYLATVRNTYEESTPTETVEVWEVSRGRRVACLSNLVNNAGRKPVFHPASKVLAVPNWDTVLLVDLATGKTVGQVKHAGELSDFTFSADGLWLATASQDNTARIWDWRNCREVARLEHPREVNKVVFNADGHQLATSSRDYVRLWHWQTGDLLAAACGRLTQNLSREEWHEYLGDEPYRATCPQLPLPEK